ncbi:hypothetical protein E2C01_074394 [Portunus trituberculatus]|uniref:Uncharacterized protein n=1 Tax=Portunus trituberculatus TaxID=210409 RepID=A0A5B7IC15_PORTR|nr:hypothetical protein [Portunus trituberculatus]
MFKGPGAAPSQDDSLVTCPGPGVTRGAGLFRTPLPGERRLGCARAGHGLCYGAVVRRSAVRDERIGERRFPKAAASVWCGGVVVIGFL